MKKVIIFLTLSVCIPLMILNAQWQISFTLSSYGTVNSIVFSGNNLFAGADYSGVYRSTNNGTNWTQTSLNNKTVKSLAILGNNIFAGTWNGGIYLSQNNGTTWTLCGLNNSEVVSLTVCGNKIFAGTHGDGVYLSSNNGSSWSWVGINYGFYDEINAETSDGSNVFISRIGTGVLSSSCGFINWTQITPDSSWIFHNSNINAITVSGSYIYFGTYGYGVFMSSNYGISWTPTSLSNPSYICSMASLGNNVFAGGDGHNFHVSTNYGNTWALRIEGLSSSDVYSLCIVNNYIFCGTSGKIFRRPLSELIGIKQISELVPNKYTISQNYPNPFNPTTTIRMDIPKTSDAKLIVYDILGKEIATLVNEKLQHGTYEVTLDGSQYPSGAYFYRLTTDNFTDTKKMVLLK